MTESSTWPIGVTNIMHLVAASEGSLPNQYDPKWLSAVSGDFSAKWVPSAAPLKTKSPADMRIGILGHHLPITLEPMLAMLGVVDGTLLRYTVRGFYYACMVEPQLCRVTEDQALTKLLRRWMSTLDATTSSEVYQQLIVDFHREVQQDREFASSDAFICTDLLSYCVELYRAVGGQTLTVYTLTETLQSVPEEFKPAMLFDTLVMKDSLITNSAYYSSRLFIQSAAQIPFASPLSWHVHLRGPASYKPNPQAEVLLFRSPGFDDTKVGNLFHLLMKHFAPSLTLFAMRCSNERHCRPKGQLSYQDIASHIAAVWFPHDFELASFYDLYAMSMPLYLPGKDWCVRHLEVIFRKHGSMVQDLSGRLPTEEVEKLLIPYFPHWDLRGPPDAYDLTAQKIRYWHDQASFASWPHVQRFDSVPSLVTSLHQIRFGDLGTSISSLMRRHHDQESHRSLSLWASRLNALGVQTQNPATTPLQQWLLEARERALSQLKTAYSSR
eukprot:TRINITY_DN78807_c0_g1_i1.p1 TRINITY_DN78807_c0_g1~~TRINITY_DN78807_c0_g1_i1.p1  ORF type:complete len:520 (-),score=52.79 TRINITY_DN78807_c0_g1_i1:188-1678(-)